MKYFFLIIAFLCTIVAAITTLSPGMLDVNELFGKGAVVVICLFGIVFIGIFVILHKLEDR